MHIYNTPCNSCKTTEESFVYFVQTKLQTTQAKLENVAIIAMYCHLRPPGAIAFPT